MVRTDWSSCRIQMMTTTSNRGARAVRPLRVDASVGGPGTARLGPGTAHYSALRSGPRNLMNLPATFLPILQKRAKNQSPPILAHEKEWRSGSKIGLVSTGHARNGSISAVGLRDQRQRPFRENAHRWWADAYVPPAQVRSASWDNRSGCPYGN